MTTKSDKEQTPFIVTRNVNKETVTRIAATADFQVGTRDAPRELQLLGRLSLQPVRATTNDANNGVVQLTNNDSIVEIQTDLVNVISSSIILPSKSRNGQVIFIKDYSGAAETFPVNIKTQDGSLIDNTTNYEITTNFGSVSLFWNIDRWQVLIAGGGSISASIKSEMWARPQTALKSITYPNYEFDFEWEYDWNVSSAPSVALPISGSAEIVKPNAYDSTFTTGDVKIFSNPDERPSWLLIQPPGNGQTISVYRSITLPTNLLTVARLKFNADTAITSNEVGIGIGFCVANDGLYYRNNSFDLWLNESDTSTIQAEFFSTTDGDSESIGLTTDVDSSGQALDHVAIHKIGTTYHGWVGTTTGNWIYLGNAVSANAFNLFGILVINANALTPAPKVFGVDYVRFFETDNFLL